jgi:hypothetical protein
MRTFAVHSIEIGARFEKAFAYIADPHNLSAWTSAFKNVQDGRAVMETSAGKVEIGLAVEASRQHGTVDWIMTFPDGAVAKAYSRLIESADKCIYSFVLTATPVLLEQLEGALDQQSRVLREELVKLRRALEA